VAEAKELAAKLFGAAMDRIKEAPQEIGAEMKNAVAHGAHELAAALFNNSAFVMYPRGTKDDHGQAKEGQDQEHQQDRGKSM